MSAPGSPGAAPLPGGGAPILSLRGIGKRFGSAVALDDVSLDVEAGEIFALLGPSGCGKSTLLRIVAGLESPSAGQLLLDGTDVVRVPANKRPVNMVFQSYAVFPHMSVARNIGYGLEMERVPRDEIASRVTEAIAQVRLDGLGGRMPDQLSGGQRQRVALARALVKRPRLLLLDEPLSALDAKLRDAMRLELVNLQSEVGVTFVIVTHDQSEAMALADRIAVLERGRLRQVGSPEALYRRPVDAFVADFIGTLHALPVSSVESPAGGGTVVEAEGLGRVEIPAPPPPGVPVGHQGELGTVLAVRPEDVGLVPVGSASPGADGTVGVDATLGDIAFQGGHSIVEARLAGGRSLGVPVGAGRVGEFVALERGAALRARWPADRMLLLPGTAPAGASTGSPADSNAT